MTRVGQKGTAVRQHTNEGSDMARCRKVFKVSTFLLWYNKSIRKKEEDGNEKGAKETNMDKRR